jgi:hypothetical protein
MPRQSHYEYSAQISSRGLLFFLKLCKRRVENPCHGTLFHRKVLYFEGGKVSEAVLLAPREGEISGANLFQE